VRKALFEAGAGNIGTMTIAVLALTAFSLSKETKIVIPLLVRKENYILGTKLK
jgi:hypothetical protein